MVEKGQNQTSVNLHLTSSGTKIWNQFMMFVVVGLLPVIFPRWIHIENRTIVFANVTIALVTSYVYEIWRKYLEKHQKSVDFLVKIQLLTSIILLTIFLHFFGRINGPFFVLYLLTVMESSLNLNITLAEVIVTLMTLFTIIEFIYLTTIGEIAFGFISAVQLVVRILSLVFIRAYGVALAQTIISEKRAYGQMQKTANKLERTTRKLQKANIRLQELSSLKDEFVSIASHQLRTPMTSIKSYLWLALNKKGNKLNQNLRRNLERAYLSTERTINLVKDMLTVSRIEGKRLDLDVGKADLHEIAQRVYQEIKIKADEKKIKLVLERPKTKMLVKADQERVREVFQNLLDNAIKFTPLEGTVKTSFIRTSRGVETSVSDTGPGISEEDMPKLFQKFGRLEHSFSSLAENPGTGLGLYISKQIIGLHKGAIRVKSKVGRGSTFTFSLPRI